MEEKKKKTVPPPDDAELSEFVKSGESAETAGTEEEASDPGRAERPSGNGRKGFGRSLRIVLSVFTIAVILTALIGLGAALQYYVYHQTQYRITMKAAEQLEKSGLYLEAEDLTEEELSHNFLYEPYRTEIFATVRQLWEEERFAEAYRILLDTPYASLLQKTCAKAADLALSEGSFETAYVYAVSAPEPFPETVIEAAQAAAYDAETGELNQAACRVLLKSGEPERIDGIVRQVLDRQMEQGNYLSAGNLSEMLPDPEEGAAVRAEIVRRRAEEAMDSRDYAEVLRILREEGDQLNDPGYIDETMRGIYEICLSERNLAEAAKLAAELGCDFTEVEIRPEDADLRLALADGYFLLSSEQKRTYHSHPLAAYTLTYAAVNGRLTYQNHGSDAFIEKVSAIAASEFFALILHENGTTELLSELPYHHPETTARSTELLPKADVSGEVVDIAAGDRHAVYLMADGTVRASGDNTYGQCETADWTDIVAVAAGKRFTVGLRADGTAVACGSNACGQCELEGYRNIVDVRACWQSTILLFRDGTAAVVGERGRGLDEVYGWKNLRRIRAGACAVVGETADGSYLCCGDPAPDLSELQDAADLAVSPFGVSAITADGKVRTFQ